MISYWFVSLFFSVCLIAYVLFDGAGFPGVSTLIVLKKRSNKLLRTWKLGGKTAL